MRIRHVLITFLILSALGAARGEETLLPSGELRSGGFGGPVIKFGPVNDQAAVLVGGRGGWLINSVFSIGGGGYGVANRVTTDHPDSLRMDMGYGGFIMEAVFLPNRLVHGTFSVLIGGGSVNMHESMHRGDGFDREDAETFFVLEPEVNLELNVVRFFRFCPGIGYRWMAGDTRFLDSDWDISGFTGNLTFKFGRF